MPPPAAGEVTIRKFKGMDHKQAGKIKQMHSPVLDPRDSQVDMDQGLSKQAVKISQKALPVIPGYVHEKTRQKHPSVPHPSKQATAAQIDDDNDDNDDDYEDDDFVDKDEDVNDVPVLPKEPGEGLVPTEPGAVINLFSNDGSFKLSPP